MIWEPGVSILFPSIGYVILHTLPSTSALGWVPPLHMYNEMAGLLVGRPASLRRLRSAVPLVRACSLSQHRARRREPGLVHRAPAPDIEWKRRGLPGSWGTIACVPC